LSGGLFCLSHPLLRLVGPVESFTSSLSVGFLAFGSLAFSVRSVLAFNRRERDCPFAVCTLLRHGSVKPACDKEVRGRLIKHIINPRLMFRSSQPWEGGTLPEGILSDEQQLSLDTLGVEI
jgi:hypothetical protein